MSGGSTELEFDPSDESRNRNGEADPPKVVGTPVATAAHYLSLADQAYRWGHFERALKHYTRTLREDRQLTAAWVGQVQMLVQLGDLNEARLWGDKALELFRNDGDLLASRAQASIRLGDRDSAKAFSEAALQAPPTGGSGGAAWRWIARGEVLLADKQRRHRDCFERAISEPGSDWFDRVVIARVYLFYRQAARAAGCVQQAINISPGHGYNWFVLGECQSRMGWTGAAMRSYKRCLALEPHYRPAFHAHAKLAALSPWARLCRFLSMEIKPR